HGHEYLRITKELPRRWLRIFQTDEHGLSGKPAALRGWKKRKSGLGSECILPSTTTPPAGSEYLDDRNHSPQAGRDTFQTRTKFEIAGPRHCITRYSSARSHVWRELRRQARKCHKSHPCGL